MPFARLISHPVSQISKAFCQVFPNAATCTWSWGRMKISVLKPRVTFTVCLSAQDFYYSVKHPLNPPTWCILLSWSLHYPLREEELPFSSLSEHSLAESVAATLSSVPSGTLFGRASQNSAILLLTFPLLQGNLIIFSGIILWITSGSTSAFLLLHICFHIYWLDSAFLFLLDNLYWLFFPTPTSNPFAMLSSSISTFQ